MTKQRNLFIVLAQALLLTACYNGDEQAFIEAVEVSELNIVSISLTPGDQTIEVNQVKAFRAMADISDSAEDLDISDRVRWSTSDSAIATINSSGSATGIADGIAEISVQFADLNATIDLTVSSAPIQSIAIDGIPASVSECSSDHQLVANGTYGVTDVRDVSDLVTWSSGTEAVATISTSGVVTTLSGGTSAITAAYDGQQDTQTLTVDDDLNTIDVTPDGATLTVGANQQYTATGNYNGGGSSNITEISVWTAENTDAGTDLHISVSDAAGTKGIGTGVSVGTVQAIANCGGVEGRADITVEEAVVINAIEIVPETTGPFNVNDSPIQLEAFLKFSNGNLSTEITDSEFITWSIESVKAGTTAELATADPNKGLVTFTATGTTEIRAYYNDPDDAYDPFQTTYDVVVE